MNQAQNLLDRQLPFCLIRLPNTESPLLLSGFQTSKPEDGPYVKSQDWDGKYKSYFSLDSNHSSVKVLDTFAIPGHTSFEDYSQQFEKFQKAFINDGIRKAILSRVINVDRPKQFEPLTAFAKLCEARKDTFNYLLADPYQGRWMGASPEILLKKRGERGQTVSLAGTQAKSEGKYIWQEKEREEQELVSEHIRSVLQKAEITNMKEVGPNTSEAGNVAHLKTTFDFDFSSDLDPLNLVDQLHPTPAISGLPVADATKLINQTESHQRQLYTGYLGLVNNDCIDIYVNLRCMQIHADQISIYVGGGITKKSILEDEWLETEAKAKTMKNIVDESK
jgi:isochorismate synthase